MTELYMINHVYSTAILPFVQKHKKCNMPKASFTRTVNITLYCNV